MPVWVRRGDAPRVWHTGSLSGVRLVLTIKVRDPKTGRIERTVDTFAANATRTQATFISPHRFKLEGEVVACEVNFEDLPPIRGETYVRVDIDPTGDTLAYGYVYAGHVVDLGERTEPGPAGGDGRFFFETIAADEAGNVATTYTPAVDNTRRKLYGFVWYYNADGNAASRVLNWKIRRPWGTLPTGFVNGAASDIVDRNGPTLTVNEEGGLFVYAPERGDGFIAMNDNGGVSWENPTTMPNPFPFLLREDDPMTLILTPSAGLAGDLYSAYALVEEWLEI